ncbi:hypothetical protein scyTo_0009950 [Scyliorhinus torazame]|uniref:Uncharacterized protein n=1 Tax=Scyliorhinus torazame TaxID=75743 RepID=A0A401NWU3_SCYTO|nr:hypothetical protein [Scyliorhinus torazame]
MEKIQLEKRELWEIERSKDQEKLRQAIQEALQEERNKSQLDQVARQRNLASLGLFLSCAQKQLSALLDDVPVAMEQDSE